MEANMSKKLLSSGIILLFSAVLFSGKKTAEINWPMFRGLNGSGICDTTGLPLEFGPGKNVVWQTSLPVGYSSPVLSDKYIFLTGEENEALFTLCLDRKNGKVIWRKKAPRPRKEKIDRRNNPASPTPVIDGEQIYVFFPDFGMLAYDYKGKELWRVPLGPFNNLYGMGASPVVADDKVILVMDQNTNSYIIALDKKTGKTAWKKERPEAKSGHSTPIIYIPEDGEKQVIVPGSFLLISYSVKTGERVWWVNGLSFEMKSTPVVDKGILYINGYASPLNQPENQVKIPDFKQALSKYDKNGDKKLKRDELPSESPYDWTDFVDLNTDGYLDSGEWDYFQAALASLNGMLAIRLGGRGDMTEKSIVWIYRKFIPQLPSPLLYKNVLYMVDDNGRVTTFKPENGEVLNQGRLRNVGSHFYSSPVAADNKVFIISLRGKVCVLGPGGSLDVLVINDLKDQCYATPAIAESRLYIRTVKTLYCFGQVD
jgi:outer membrane protein assembly factor BamB